MSVAGSANVVAVRARTIPEIASAARREAEVRTSARRTESALRRAAREGTPVLLGPFLGEIGYELEYWIPFARRLLHEHGIDPERVTVMTRGGAGLWYRDFASNTLDVLDLLTPEEYLPRLEDRRRRAGDLKQLRVERFDRELLALARDRLGELTAVHPGLMFTRLRGLWFRDEPLDTLWPQVEYRRLEVEPERPHGVPADYVAVKAYFNEVLPATDESRSFLRGLIERLTERIDVVLLSTGLLVDDHEEWEAATGRVHSIERLLRPQDNLAVQSRLIAGARGLVATYGGFSYLGPFLGVPTLTFHAVEQTVPLHLEVVGRGVAGADYERVPIGAGIDVEGFVSRVLAPPG
jgi:hypothetical protein